MTKAQRIAHKKGNAKRRQKLLNECFGSKREESLKQRTGGIGQKSKYSPAN